MALREGPPHPYDYQAAAWSILPGLGQALRGNPRHAAVGCGITLALILPLWALSRVGGPGTAVFLFVLIVLPWWVFQAYAAGLGTADDRPGYAESLRIVLERGHDIRFLGGLFLLTALVDLYIIVANPAYALAIFCAKPGGILGVLAKAQSPTLHVLIGYGFLRIQRWSLFLYMAYAAFGVLNATASFACFGYGRVRTAFLLSLIVFTLYIFQRRRCFTSAAPHAA